MTRDRLGIGSRPPESGSIDRASSWWTTWERSIGSGERPRRRDAAGIGGFGLRSAGSVGRWRRRRPIAALRELAPQRRVGDARRAREEHDAERPGDQRAVAQLAGAVGPWRVDELPGDDGERRERSVT